MTSGSWKGLALLAVGLAGAVAGAAVYLEHRAGEAVDHLARVLEPAGQLSYGSLAVSADGSLTLSDVDWEPANTGGQLFVRQLRLDPGGPLALLELGRQIRRGRWPESLEVTAEDILLDTSGPLAKRASGPWGLLPLATPADARGCGATARVDAAMLADMGFSMLSTDLVARLRRLPGGNELRLRWQAETSGLSGHQLDLRLQVDPRHGPAQLGAARLLELSLGYTDLGFGRSRNLYCAGRLGLDAEAFVQHQVEAVARSRQTAPGADLRGQYTEFLRQGGELRWHSRPGEPAPTLGELAAMDAPQRLAALAPSLAINDRPVAEPAQAWLPRRAPETRSAEAATAPDTQPGAGLEGAAFEPVEVTELAGLDGYTLRLRTRQGAELQGVLLQVGERELVLQRRVSGGSAQLPVQLADIEELEVFR